MRVVFFTPYYKQNRGNSTTAKRLEHGLSDKVEFSFFPYEELSLNFTLLERMVKADLYHILHFSRFVQWAEKNEIKLDKPYIVTSGGTDLNHSLTEDEERYLPLLREAKAITVFTQEAKQMLVKDYGLTDQSVHVIPQSIYLPNDHTIEAFTLPEGYPKLLLPAGIRPVKDVLFALESLIRLSNDFLELRFLIVGANLNEEEFERVKEAENKYEWLYYLPEVELGQMKKLYEWGDVVLNTSISEGQPTALLEAMSFRKPVIARENPGNASIIQHGMNGLLFQSQEELYHSIKNVISDQETYKQLSDHGYQTIIENHTIKKEIDSYLKLYKEK
ncbi:glycosyltransferase [Fictibacillus nanhaiensis]|uniref:glycosyltransferase n=1 Tax=Fictibacillus nanhaiensis TaxID=742169 RepID=UPI002E22FB12|nr:glycosyltransferase [Fictibacillus nanhaiensis]MED1865665.1 glycosyltransferase [Fictibacillus nanhaiensis]